VSAVGRLGVARGLGQLAVSALIVLFTLAPFLYLLSQSLTPEQRTFTRGIAYLPDPVSLANYGQLLARVPYLQYFRSSAIVAVLTTALSLGVSIPAAYAFARFQFRGRRVLIVSLLLAYMFPSIVLIIPMMVLFKHLGLMNTYWAVVLAEASHAAPFAIWLLTGYFATLPKETEEAALVDGCSLLAALWRVVLPVALPGLVAAGMFVFIASWNNFLFAFMLTSGNDVRTLPVALRAFLGGEAGLFWGTVSASAVSTTVPVALLFFFFQRYLIQGLTAGSVKG
jgi:multiple sugar transport system permease protein